MKRFLIGVLAIMITIAPVADCFARAGSSPSRPPTISRPVPTIPKAPAPAKPAYEPKPLTLGDKGPTKVVPQEQAKPIPAPAPKNDPWKKDDKKPVPMYKKEEVRPQTTYTPPAPAPVIVQQSSGWSFSNFLMGMGLGWLLFGNHSSPTPVQAAPAPVATAPVQTGPSKEYHYWNTATDSECTPQQFKDKSVPCEMRPGKSPAGNAFDKEWDKGAE